mgnify:CR=1 FL=1
MRAAFCDQLETSSPQQTELQSHRTPELLRRRH